MIKQRRIAIFVPHQGCPKDCVFCNQARITGQKREEQLTEEQIRAIVDQHLRTMDEKVHVEIAFFGGSFTGLPRGYQKMMLGVAKEYIDNGQVQGIRFSTRPDYINEAIMEFLLPYGVTAIELGVQSLDDHVLALSQRGHTAEQVATAVEIIRNYPSIQLGLQLLPGLPGDTKEIAMNTAQQVVNMRPDFVRIYPALVIAGTELEWMYATKQYKPLSLEEAVDWCAQIWLLFMKHQIQVIRLGLHASEDLRAEGSLIAGPFHPSFRQLVEAKLYRRLLDTIVKDYSSEEIDTFMIHPADETAVRGPRGANWASFAQSSVDLALNSNVERHQCQLAMKSGKIISYRLRDLESSS
ncbi:hypothetical protein BEP19_07130 [Ammoniphilus oxalaticus]|uniref:Radical SAM core domain-containing protein n=1 Tax=Ammoniphilus oxalaticus TaxID=66863 RepID=A0A419SJN3_9BACL|nr:radical SAM protein [Ammoniphilus oxalaticus]RKD24172.1 hypothetical protein BEP19_07130 [Ammoniphilus oxalaticus]